MYLSKSPIKTDEVDDNVGGALCGSPWRADRSDITPTNLKDKSMKDFVGGTGHLNNQTASSTAAELVEEGEVGVSPVKATAASHVFNSCSYCNRCTAGTEISYVGLTHC